MPGVHAGWLDVRMAQADSRQERAAGTDPRLSAAIGWYTGTAGHVDDGRAHELLLDAAASGDAVSRMWLARCYSTGRMGFPRDQARARQVAADVIDAVRARADRGEVEAVFLMGNGVRRGPRGR